MNFDQKYRNLQLKVIGEIDSMYDEIIDDLLPITVAEEGYFYLKNHKRLNKKVDTIIEKISRTLDKYIKLRCTDVFELSNLKNNSLVDKLYSQRKKVAPNALFEVEKVSLDKFLSRKVKDLTLSQRVWNINESLKKEIESSINAALEKGQSAESLARELKKYLNNPDARFRRIRDKFGKLAPSKNALSYHPGRGVYRSAKQNALRLARNEINKAYRLADWERWKKLPFIIGFKIRNSNRIASVCETCKHFDGKVFPKTYKFEGFHVSCMCTAIPIMAKEPELSKIISGQPVELDYPPMPEVG